MVFCVPGVWADVVIVHAIAKKASASDVGKFGKRIVL
jgi:hypothetical protein